jgi:hypothetical protein
MYGSAIGTLNVYANNNLIWTLNGDQGQGWNLVQIPLTSTGNTLIIEFEGTTGSSWAGDIAIDNIEIIVTQQISGCTNPLACNYDASATVDDGSCLTDYGCTDPLATNYDASATCDDGNCFYVMSGCTDPIACNYNPSAITDDGSCFYQSNPVIDMSLYTWTFNTQWGCSGTIYSAQMEFDSSGTGVVNPGTVGATNVNWSLCDSILSWVYSGGTLYTSINYNNGIFTGTMISGSTTGCFTLTPIIPGCMDSTSLLYNPQANVSDGSCCEHYLRLNMYSSWTGGWSGGIYWTMMDNNGDTVISTSLTYNSSTDTYHNVDYICIPDGCYSIVCSNGGGSGGISWTLKDDSTNATILSGGCPFGPYFVGIGTSCPVMGCTDPSADNYDASATNDDGSCTYTVCNEDAPTGLFVDGIIHSRAVINWDNMNSSTCTVDQYRIRYRVAGTSSWTNKTMGGPIGSCTWGNQRIDKLLLGLTGATTYEYQMKAWYCGGGASSWTTLNNFTTADNCPNVGNLAAYGATPTKATFTWDDSNGPYEFVRLKSRIDSISNPSGFDWFQIGGSGVAYGTFTKNKNGLTPGETYRAQARAFCDPNGGAYFSLGWSPLVYWTQPVVRVEGGTAIANLAIYPNPSRDVFNISFTSETVQDLKVRILNVVGEVIISEDLDQFVGEYTKQINLHENAKGIYFLEIETDNGIINKKLILQ